MSSVWITRSYRPREANRIRPNIIGTFHVLLSPILQTGKLRHKENVKAGEFTFLVI